ncbi:EAL domain-containing protein [Curvibacter sp. APW13]|uniref:bifunctional diguanylate cyclase/phosphodiesterase n=1 Tax=Curvibacter sp. APW13 TaxID=3077236 RepID=UPI0028DD61AA|nr:EAL domain-containing protein [Curvibacter sp. APW13]MDT8990411.1 EAL domain-containing protein [Curvibacter sp. APW13]
MLSPSDLSPRKTPTTAPWFGRAYYAVALALIGTIAVVAGLAMQQLRDSTVARINAASKNTAASIVQTIDGTFSMIDVALLASADEIARQLASGHADPASISTYLETQSSRIPHFAYFRGTDARGLVVYGKDLPAAPVSLADREFFTTLRDHPDSGLFVAKPVLARIAQRYVLTLARRITTRDGRFAGTVYASIYVDELQNMLSRLPIGEQASVGLRDRDMGLIARHVFGVDDPIPIGSTKVSTPFTQALADNPNEGSYVSDATSLDPFVRFYSYQRSARYGYLVNVGLSPQIELESWRRQAGIVGGLIGTLALLLLVFAYQSSRALVRREEYLEGVARMQGEHRDLMENLQTGVLVNVPGAGVTYANAKALELLGVSAAQLYGTEVLDPRWQLVSENGAALAPEDYPAPRVIRDGVPIREVVVGVKIPERAGTRWLLASAFPSFDAAGNIRHVVVNFYDTTQRKEAEDRWKFALEGSGDGFWDIDMERGQAICSRRYYEMLGYAEGEVPSLHKEWLQHVHPDDLERMRSDIATQLASPLGTFATEYRIRCKDGSYKWILARGMAVNRAADGTPLRMVGSNTDISELKAAEQKAWNQANFDALTGLPNRRLFYDRLDMKIRRAERTSEVLALLFIDLDQFKEVNDTLGHQVGDALLVEAATRIKSCVRDYDTVARLGGDEFTVIISDQHKLDDIGPIAQKIIDQVSQPFLLHEHTLYVSASIGIALYPSDAQTVNELIKNADQAMYAAKAGGRQRFCFFTKNLQDSAVERMHLVADLRVALAQRQLEVFYQPIVDLRSGEVRKAEALLRWHHPTRGAVSPAQFIPIAEEVGAIHDIGDWVFETAVTQLRAWHARFGPQFQISINKSPVQFEARAHRPSGSHWLRYLEEQGVSPESIVVEITEGVLMDGHAHVTDKLIQYRDCGIQVAVDDFGTGYSSLSYLRKFDIDYLKIDQSFVRNLQPGSSEMALCEGIVAMAHSLGLAVIAEGVETAEQRDILQAMGCDFAQGYFYARPAPAAEFERFLSARVT